MQFLKLLPNKQTILCDWLDWHKPDGAPVWFDGCSFHSFCIRCGEEIMEDSQGGWFRIDRKKPLASQKSS